jgi:glutamate transport system permease protein
MSDDSILYDQPGPRARRRARVGGIAAVLVLLGLIAVVLVRLAGQDQLSGEYWGPILNPGNDDFPLVWNLIGQGLVATLKAAALAITFSLVLGMLIGVSRMMLGRWGRMPVVGLIELLRGLPVVITIFMAYRFLPELGIDLSGMPGGEGLWFVVIGLTLYNSVIIAEILRAGVASLPRGQDEAARSIGLTRGGSMRLILLPQAVRVMLPALISQLVVILKDTSLAAVLGIYTELLKQGNQISLSLHNPIQILTVVGLIYILINYCLSRLATWLEHRSSRKKASQLDPAAADAAGVGAGA